MEIDKKMLLTVFLAFVAALFVNELLEGTIETVKEKLEGE